MVHVSTLSLHSLQIVVSPVRKPMDLDGPWNLRVESYVLSFQEVQLARYVERDKMIIIQVLIIVIVIAIIYLLFKPADNRFGPNDLLSHPGEIHRNVVNKIDSVRNMNDRLTKVPCELPCVPGIGCPPCHFVGPPFTTQCGGNCLQDYGRGWRDVGAIGGYCRIGSGLTRRICQKII